VYFVKKQIPSNYCQVLAQYYATSIHHGLIQAGTWAMVPVYIMSIIYLLFSNFYVLRLSEHGDKQESLSHQSYDKQESLFPQS